MKVIAKIQAVGLLLVVGGFIVLMSALCAGIRTPVPDAHAKEQAGWNEDQPHLANGTLPMLHNDY